MRISPRNRAATSWPGVLGAISGARALDALIRDLNRASATARAFVSATPSDFVSAAASDFVSAAVSARNLDRDLAGARALIRDLAAGYYDHDSTFSALVSALDSALDSANAHAYAWAIDRTRDRTRTRDLDLVRALNRARARALHFVSPSEGERVGERGRRLVPLAGRLLSVAAHLLPAGHRARYAQEFRSELTEIARAGGGRRSQLAYAARVMMSAPRLRADLRAPRRRRAAP